MCPILQCKERARAMYSDRLRNTVVLALGLTVIDAARKLMSGAGLGFSETFFSVAGNLLLAYFLIWLQGRCRLQRRSVALLLWVNLFIVGSFSNMLEGYFFTSVFESANQFIAGGLYIMVFSGLEAGFASQVLPAGENDLSERLRAYIGGRTRAGLAMRVALGALSYLPVYFFFGMLVIPFVMPYYTDPSMGLVVPPFSTIISLEVLRGLIYVAVLLPVAACLDADRLSTSVALAGVLFIPGALLPLLADQGLPSQIIPFHLVEILAVSVVYSYILARLFASKKRA